MSRTCCAYRCTSRNPGRLICGTMQSTLHEVVCRQYRGKHLPQRNKSSICQYTNLSAALLSSFLAFYAHTPTTKSIHHIQISRGRPLRPMCRQPDVTTQAEHQSPSMRKVTKVSDKIERPQTNTERRLVVGCPCSCRRVMKQHSIKSIFSCQH